ncbi:general stress protein [Dankookia rubra]|uniref:general stress protein n=1 Tax=Dankookia rubra TaxID=1442381 RepID=UPI001878CE6A|nr:general stress protein [Dankookia rubra]
MATRTIARLFDSYSDASSAVRDLEAAGFQRDDISLIANRGEDGTTTTTTGDTTEETSSGAGTGATLGTLVGGGAGLLAGLGALAIPGLGPIVAAGWLVAAVTGAGVGAAAGGLLGALTGSGLSEEESHVYAEGVRRGGNLVTVRVDESRSAEVESIMQRHNAATAETRGADYRAGGWTGYDGAADPSSGLGTAAGVGTTTAAAQMGTRTGTGTRTDASLVGGAPDGTPGNPPGTMLSRGADDVLGTNMSGARPENESHTATGGSLGSTTRSTSAPDGTPGNPPGTKLSRAADDALGTNVSGARPQNETRGTSGLGSSAPDGTPGNPPGTKLSRGVDEVAGTNVSGAHPENEAKGATGNTTPGTATGGVTGNPRR